MNDLSGISPSTDAKSDFRLNDTNQVHPDAMTTLSLSADFDHAAHNQASETAIDPRIHPRAAEPIIYDSSLPVERMDDHMLIAGTREGDELAFQELVNRYRNPITNFVYRMLNDYDRAVDLAQETFVRVYMNVERYQANYSFSTYIYRIASNLAITDLRQRVEAL